MDVEDLILSIVPAGLAVVLQYWHFPTDQDMEKAGKSEAKRTGLPIAADIEYNLKGAIAKSSIAPTIVSAFSSAAALFHNQNHGTIFLYLDLTSTAVILIWLYTRISGLSFYELATLRYPNLKSKTTGSNPPGTHLPYGPMKKIDCAVYALNSIFVAVSLFVFFTQSTFEAPTCAASQPIEKVCPSAPAAPPTPPTGESTTPSAGPADTPSTSDTKSKSPDASQ